MPPRNDARFPNVPQVEVQFYITGELDPARVTQIVGTAPSSTARRGTRVMTAKRVIPVEDLWCLRINELDTLDATPLLEQAVALLEPLAKPLRDVRGLYPKASMSLIVVEFVPTGAPRAVAPRLSLSHELLTRLARLGVTLTRDCMLLARDDEGQRWQLDGAVRAD